MIYQLLYVDDILLATKTKTDVARLKEMLNLEFDMKDLGTTRKNLGMEIYRDRPRGKLFLTQKSYIERFYLVLGWKI